MDSDTRSLQMVAAAAAVAAAVTLLVDADGTVLVAIAFVAVAVAWWFAPGVLLGDRPGRGTVVRRAAILSIVVSLALVLLLLLA